MPSVVINGRFLLHRITGVERYAREIIAELDKIVQPEQVELACPPEVTEIPAYKNIKVVRVGWLHNQLWEHVSFPLYVARKKAVSLNLCNVAPLLCPGIVCIHDMKVRATPHFFSKKFLLWYRLLFSNAARRARKIITVSNFSKSELIKYYGVDPDKVVVAPNGWQHFEKVCFEESSCEKYGVEKGAFFFSMCSLEPNKNFKWIAESAKRNPLKTFVVAGSINKKVFADGLGFECPANMKLIGYVSDEEAKTLMRDCEAFIFPSFYEGFGIPPLEAVCAGAKKIVVSDIPVMHEIFENAAVFIDPKGYVDFSQLTNPMCSNVKSKYSWNHSATTIKDVLNL